MNSARISFALFGIVILLITKDIWRLYYQYYAPKTLSVTKTSSPLPDLAKSNVSEVVQQGSNPSMLDSTLYHYPRKRFESLYQFESTIKSCLGRYCMDEVFGDDGEIKRYGLLAPFLSPEIQYIKKLVSRLKAKGYEIELTKHVPPYGYGRNHGWSRIVRFIDNVPLSAFHQLLQVTNSSSISNKKVFAAQVRALARWHCRLNHVAAHTSMLTVHLDSFERNPISTMQNILSFINAKDIPSIIQSLDTNALSQKKSLLALPMELAILADETLEDELRISKNLTRWPCRNFKELSADLLVQPYYELAAGCSSSKYVKCSVQYDFSEQPQLQKRYK
jgi:hypothetical protein